MNRIIKLAIICASIVGLAIVSVHAFQSNNSDKSSMTTRPSNWAEPITLAGVPNLHKVTDNLYRSAQPTAEGMSNLAELGIKTVINLRDNHSDKDEIGELPLNARRIEIFAGNMKDEYVEEFLSIVNDTSAVPVLVHCLHGADRTGTMCAMYRILCQGWSPNDAINEMENGGYGYHSIWSNIPRFIRESTKRFVARKELVE